MPFLLCALVLALLCNRDTLEAVGQWCAEQRDLLAGAFPGPRFHTPTGSLYRRLLPRLSVVHLEAARTAWVRSSLSGQVSQGRSFREAIPMKFDQRPA